MKQQDLSGIWTLCEIGGEAIQGHIPGCNYLDLMRAGRLDDPYWELNEYRASKLAQKDYCYTRNFTADAALFAEERVDLVLSGVDTLAEISLNGHAVAKTQNCHRSYRFPVQNLLQPGENRLEVLLRSPVTYARAAREKREIPNMAAGEKGVNYLRKVQCHFGWDWGPILPPSGITGDVRLEGYSRVRIADVAITQQHSMGSVTLNVRASLDGSQPDACAVSCTLTAPDGTQTRLDANSVNGRAGFTIPVEQPQLWWCNGLGEAPLYTVTVYAEDDKIEKQIGLRTITLDSGADEWGSNFCFSVNGVPIFAKGANWIPSDCFVNRTTAADLEWYIRAAKDANMNMLRVWGGGYYESDVFYELCDRYGILVWQDFGFACALYPLDEAEFLENVRHEVEDNVLRLRHHASLALWCGNNEIQMSAALWAQKRQNKLYAVNNDFFFTTLRKWVNELDGITPYWPGSPSSGVSPKDAVNMHKGDAHLWTVWHGMLPIEAYRKMPARFCSEFGMESFPSLRTIAEITDEKQSSIFSPVMLSHQKCGSGNAKMLYYLLAKYRNPASLPDFIYLSQLVQAETMRYATEFWRRNRGRCNGSLYWQYNDCWPVASWAGIDYGKRYKALQYLAKRFFAPVCIAADLYKERADCYVMNDLAADFQGTATYRIVNFDGTVRMQGKKKLRIAALSAKKALQLRYRDVLNRGDYNNCALLLRLEDANGTVVSESYSLLVPDRLAALTKPHITSWVKTQGSLAYITLQSDRYARFVRLEIEGIDTPFSDNYFDLPAGETRTVTVAIPADMNEEALCQGISLHSLADIMYQGNALQDKRIRAGILLNPKTHMAWKLPKFDAE